VFSGLDVFVVVEVVWIAYSGWFISKPSWCVGVAVLCGMSFNCLGTLALSVKFE